MQKFAIFAEPRSGTTFLNSIINQHPDIHCYGEILPGIKSEDQFHNYWLKKIEEDPQNILLQNFPKIFHEYIYHIYKKQRDKKCVGVDIKYFQLEWKPEILSVLKQNEFKVIHVIRKNLLKREVSLILHRKNTREYLNRPMHAGQEQVPVKIYMESGKRLINRLQEMKNAIDRYKYIFRANFDCIDIYYEKIVDSAKNTIYCHIMDEIYDLLGIEEKSYNFPSKLKKMNPPQLKNMIMNYHDIIDTLKDTQWVSFLDDPVYDVINKEMFSLICKGEEAFSENKINIALRSFLQAREINPDYPDCLFNLGLVYTVAGNNNKALNYFEKVMDITSDDTLFDVYANMLKNIDIDQEFKHEINNMVQSKSNIEPVTSLC